MRRTGGKVKEAGLREQGPNSSHDTGVGGSRDRKDAGDSKPASGNGVDRTPAVLVTPSVVRIARPEDATEVYRLLLLAHPENALFPIDNAQSAYFVQRFLWADQMPMDDPGPRGVIGVIGPKGGHLEAITVIGIGRLWYTQQKHLEEFIVYVDQNHRQHTNHFRALLNWLWEQSEKTGLPLLNGILSNYRTEAKVKLYERIYGEERRAGAYFIYFPKSYGKGWEHESAIVTSS